MRRTVVVRGDSQDVVGALAAVSILTCFNVSFWFYNYFIEIEFTYRKIHHVCDPVAISIVTVLVSHLSFQDIFTALCKNLIPIDSQPPGPWQSLIYFLSMDLALLDISCKCNHIIRGLFCLASCTLCSVFTVHP